MDATATRLLKFLKKSPQFIIPIYQRTYSWTETECKQLWDDIIRVGESEKVDAHFIGSIVCLWGQLVIRAVWYMRRVTSNPSSRSATSPPSASPM